MRLDFASHACPYRPRTAPRDSDPATLIIDLGAGFFVWFNRESGTPGGADDLFSGVSA
jgi:hypothetical protein